MFSLFKKPSKSRIGLDLSPEGIIMSYVGDRNGSVYLKDFEYKPFENPVYENGQIDNQKILIEELKSLINDFKPETKSTVISVPTGQVFIKKITLPDLPYEELKMIAPQEASKHLPLAAEDLTVDIQILESTRRQDETGKKIDVILCALSKAVAKSYLDTAYAAGFEVEAIDISPFAMIKTIADAKLIDDETKTYVSVLIDYANTDINVIQNGMPIFSHSVQVGRKNVIESLINSLGKPKQEAIEILPEVAILIPGAEMSENADLNKAAGAVKNVYSNISGEIQKAIEFFNSNKPEPVEIEKIIIGGPGVCVQNIDRYFVNKLRIDTQILNPFANLSKEFQQEENLLSPFNLPSFSTSIGLALKELEN